MLMLWECDFEHSVVNWEAPFPDNVTFNCNSSLIPQFLLFCIHRKPLLPRGVVLKHLHSWSPRRTPGTRTMLRILLGVTDAEQQLMKANGDQKQLRRRGSPFDPSLLTHQLRGWAQPERRPRWFCRSDGWEWHHRTVGSAGNCGSGGI